MNEIAGKTYEPGRMGIAEGMGMVFTTTFTGVFLTISAITVEIGKGIGWIIPLTAGLTAFLLFLAYLMAARDYPGHDLLSVAARSSAGGWPG